MVKIAHGNTSLIEYALTSASVSKGTPLMYIGTPGAAGYLGSGAPTSAIGIVAVAAETVDGTTNRSALASTPADGNHLVLAWPASTDNRFVAVCSSTPVIAMVDIAWNMLNTGVVANETTAEAQFVIESIVDATDKTVLGRFVAGYYAPRAHHVAGG